jgi:predicted CopG family antitoxin
MAIKTIAVQVNVYDKLERFKQPKESFSKAIDRLLSEQGIPKKPEISTSKAILDYMNGPDAPEPLTKGEAEIMYNVIRENRENATWPLHDLS